MNEIELRQELSPVITKADSIQIYNADDYEFAAGFLKEVKGAQKKVADFWAPLKKKAHEAWKGLTAKEAEMLQPLQNAENTVKNKILSFQREEEKKRLEEQRRLQAEAEQKARLERERLIKEAEKLKSPELKAQRMAEADLVEAPVVTVQKETPKVAGISTRKIWKAEVLDKREFILAALSDDNLLGFISIDLSALNRVAGATKGAIKYPGIRFYEEEILAAGGR